MGVTIFPSGGTGGGGGGGVNGPGSSTDNNLVRWDGASGALIQDSGVTLNDTEDMTGLRRVSLSQYLAAGGNVSTAATLLLTGNQTTGTDQYGANLSSWTGQSSATSSISGYASGPGTEAASFTCGLLSAFSAVNTTKGAGSTITRHVMFYGAAPTQGSNNAFVADNASFTSDHAINLASTNPVTFAGLLDAGGTSSALAHQINGASLNLNSNGTTSFVVSQDRQDSGLDLSGGNASGDGGQVVLYGPSHATEPSNIEFYQEGTQVGEFDDNGDFAVSRSQIGGDVLASLTNADTTTATSNARLSIVTSGASAGDPILRLTNGVVNWDLVLDNNDSDNLEIQIGGSPVAEFSTSGDVDLVAGDLAVSRSEAGGDVLVSVTNADTATATSNAKLSVVTSGASAGDPSLRLTNGVANWDWILDNSDSDALLLQVGATTISRYTTGGAFSLGASATTATQAVNAGKLNVNWGYLDGGNEMTLANTSTSTNAQSRIILSVDPAATNASDPKITLTVASTETFNIILDNDDSDKFKIQNGNSTILQIDPTASDKVSITSTLTVGTAQTYTPTNVTPDRSFDADTVVITELADVVGTIIADLQTIGLMS